MFSIFRNIGDFASKTPKLGSSAKPTLLKIGPIREFDTQAPQTDPTANMTDHIAVTVSHLEII